MRPVCGANIEPILLHSSKMADIINPFNDEIDKECWIKSTQEFWHSYKNSAEEFEEDLDLFNNDATPLFPSILISLADAKIREVITERKLEIQEINYIELSRLLSCCWERSKPS